MVMVPAGSPLAGKSVLTDKDIASKPLVTTNSFLRNVISQRFGSDAISFSSTDFALRKDLVVRGAAHSFLPAFSQITMAKEQDFVLRDMEHPWEVEIGFVGTEEALSAEAFQGLVRILDEFYRAHLDSGLYTLP